MDNERRLLVEISDAYYYEGQTQQQIANQLGISRMKVSRLLQKAKDQGVVKISIDYGGVHLALEKKIKETYGLQQVIIVPGKSHSLKRELANAAAHYLNNTLKKGDLVAVGWGSTLHEMVAYCEGDFKGELELSPIIGGHGKSHLNLHATTICSDLAAAWNGEPHSLLAPAYVDSKEDKATLMRDTSIASVIARTQQASKAIFGVGAPNYEWSTVHKTGYFTDEEMEQIKQSGTICELVSIAFLDQSGQPILEEITDRSVGISREALKAIPEKICIAGGFEKHDPIKIAAEAGYVDVLITDHETGTYLLD
ncbi:sugar-binding transcriptional regulator [Enterococcus olivae]